jgi:hypothetical protein
MFINDTARKHIRVFEIASNGSLAGGNVWAETIGEGAGAPDGMKIDSAGNVYCTGPGGIHVFAPDATCLGVIRTPERTANLAWGDADLRSLYITATTIPVSNSCHHPGNIKFFSSGTDLRIIKPHRFEKLSVPRPYATFTTRPCHDGDNGCGVASQVGSFAHVEQLASGVFAAGFSDHFGSANCGWVTLEKSTLSSICPLEFQIQNSRLKLRQ